MLSEQLPQVLLYLSVFSVVPFLIPLAVSHCLDGMYLSYQPDLFLLTPKSRIEGLYQLKCHIRSASEFPAETMREKGEKSVCGGCQRDGLR
jgi:hypothetical protein